MFGLTDPSTDLGSPSPSFTRKEMALLFRVSDGTIKRLTNDHRQLDPVHLNQRVLRYSEADVRSMVKLGYQLELMEAERLGVNISEFAPRIAPKPPIPSLPVAKENERAASSLLSELLLEALKDARVRAEFRTLIREAKLPRDE